MTDARSGYPSTRSLEIRIIIEDPEAIKLARRIHYLSRIINDVKRLGTSEETAEAIELLNERLNRLKEKLLTIIYEKSEEVDIKINIR